ncbi:MAG: phytanoyl-CoA dioxygenase family protein [Sphingomonadales bacterium]|nr:phytanoyl-CoA dioxygenase family protein [Sphingomonadales bacterium]
MPRLLGGEVIVVRQGLASFGVFDGMLVEQHCGCLGHLGNELTDAILAIGIERIHEIVAPERIPAMTDAIYRAIEAKAPDYLSRLMPDLFGDRDYYFETAPNVRFHIPYDSARQNAGAYANFVKKRGEGKLTAHGPHRDSWLDCPDNGVNIWIAFGHVQKGNGLTVFTKEYNKPHSFTEKGSITDDVALTEPVAFDLDPGDCVLFHTDHLHGSELNRTQETRFVISFRVTLDKPHFPREHYHSYRYSGLASGPFRALATLPSILQPSFARSGIRRVRKRLLGWRSQPVPNAANGALPPVFAKDLVEGEIRAIDAKSCVARLGDGTIVAFSRRCPHEGADLANGFVVDNHIVCPWHNLPYDPVSGASPCATLRTRTMTSVILDDGRIAIAPPTVSASETA